jgi:hypothetical protein
MYYTFDQLNNKNSDAKVSDKKYPCPNYIAPNTKNYYNYFNLPSTQNTNINELPFYKVNQDAKLVSPPETLPPIGGKSNKIAPIEEDTNNTIDKTTSATKSKTNEPNSQELRFKNMKKPNLQEISSTNMKKPNSQETYSLTEKNYNPKTEIKKKNLLPVLDSKFNYREICKQSILLEDHLSVTEKRCSDCCIKHFLALEALSEEALGLDKDKNEFKELQSLPNSIREIQKLWYQDPDGNAEKCVQDLRKIRKSLMTKCFSVVFDESKKCSGNVCSIK